MNELKPCPFCGGEAMFMTSQVGGLVRYFVTCTACGIETMRLYRTRFEAAKAWNRRVNE